MRTESGYRKYDGQLYLEVDGPFEGRRLLAPRAIVKVRVRVEGFPNRPYELEVTTPRRPCCPGCLEPWAFADDSPRALRRGESAHPIVDDECRLVAFACDFCGWELPLAP